MRVLVCLHLLVPADRIAELRNHAEYHELAARKDASFTRGFDKLKQEAASNLEKHRQARDKAKETRDALNKETQTLKEQYAEHKQIEESASQRGDKAEEAAEEVVLAGIAYKISSYTTEIASKSEEVQKEDAAVTYWGGKLHDIQDEIKALQKDQIAEEQEASDDRAAAEDVVNAREAREADDSRESQSTGDEGAEGAAGSE